MTDDLTPINILARIVIGSVNDVLAGYQTYEEHEKNLKDLAEEYLAKGIILPLKID